MNKSDLVEGVVVKIEGFNTCEFNGLHIVRENKLLQIGTHRYCYISSFDDDLEIKNIGVKITNIYSNLKTMKNTGVESMANKTEILKAIEEKRKEIENLEKELERFENPYVDIDKIERGEKYYYHRTYGNTRAYDFCGDNIDKQLINNCNAFTSEEYAEKITKRELLMRKLDRFAWDNNSNINDEDWKDDEIYKYKIFYNLIAGTLGVSTWTLYRDAGQVYFESKEVAEKAIEEFKDELLEYFNS